MKSLILFTLFVFVSSSPSPSPTPTPTPTIPSGYNIGNVTYESDSKTFFMTIIPDAPSNTTTLYYTVTAKSGGWAGIGFSKTTQMADADFIVWSKNGAIFDQTPTGEGEDTPRTDKEQNFHLVSIVNEDGWITADFWRPVETGDTKEDITIDQTKYIIWAVGPGNVEAGDYEQHSHWGGAEWVDKEAGLLVTVNKGMNLQDDHAIIMFTAWGVLVFVGLSMTKLKFLGHPWFIAHVTIQVVTLLLNLAGFILIEIKIDDNFKAHFLDAHHIIGIITFALAFITPIIGFIANLKYDPERQSIPIWPDRVHQGLGYLTIIFGIVSLFLGCDEYGAPAKLYIIIGVWIGVELGAFSIIFVIEKMYFNAKNKESEEKGKEGVSGGVKGAMIALVMLQVLGGFAVIAVFAAYVVDGDQTNIIQAYN